MSVEFGFTVECRFAISHCAFEFPINVPICMGLLVRPYIVTIGKPSTANGARIRFFEGLIIGKLNID